MQMMMLVEYEKREEFMQYKLLPHGMIGKDSTVQFLRMEKKLLMFLRPEELK